MGRAFSAIGLTLTLVLAAPGVSAAQEEPLSSFEAGAWYLTSFELTLLAEIPASLLVAGNVEHTDRALLCGILLPICLLASPGSASDGLLLVLLGLFDVAALAVVPAVTAAVADAADWPVEFPVVFTTGLSSAISLAFVGAGLTRPDLRAVGTLVGAALGLGGGLTYSILRIDPLARDPRVGIEGNFLMWTPALIGPLAALVTAALDAPPEVVLIVSGLAGLLSIGFSILSIELALAEPAASAPGPLIGASVVEF